MRRASLYTIGILALVMLVTTPVAAQEAAEEPVSLSIKPVGTPDSYFTLTAEPGEMVDLEVELANHGNNPILVQIYAADAYSLINGGFGVRLFDEPTSGATRWIDFPSEAFELDGQTTTTRSIQMEVPADAGAGEYLSALVIQNANPTGGTGEGVGFKQVNRQAIAVAVTLPGELVPGLAFGEVTHKFSGGNSVLLAEVENTGNVHMKLEGQFSVTDSGGAEVLNQPVHDGHGLRRHIDPS